MNRSLLKNFSVNISNISYSLVCTDMSLSKLFMSAWSSNSFTMMFLLFPDAHHFISCRLPHFPEASEREGETVKGTEKESDWENGSGIKRARLRRTMRKKEWWTRWPTARKVTIRHTTDAIPSHLVTCPEQERTELYHIFTILLLYFSTHLAGWKTFEYLCVLCVCSALRNLNRGFKYVF